MAIVASVVSREEEAVRDGLSERKRSMTVQPDAQDDRSAGEPLLGGRVLCAVVDLLPEGERVEYAAVRFEWCPGHVVEHEVGDLCERQ